MPDFKTDKEFFSHTTRANGDRSLVFGSRDKKDDVHGHAVLDASGRVKFLRESDGRIIADDKKD